MYIFHRLGESEPRSSVTDFASVQFSTSLIVSSSPINLWIVRSPR